MRPASGVGGRGRPAAAIRTGARPAPAGTRWCAGRPGPRVSSRSTNSCRAASSSPHPLEQLVELGLDLVRPASDTSTPVSSRRASAASARARRGLGDAGQQRQRLGRLTAVDQEAGQGLDRPGVAGLELEGPAERGLVTRLGQQVRLARGRGQSLHEGG